MKKNQILFLVLICSFVVFGCSKKNEKKSSDTQISKRIVTLSPSSTEILFDIGAGNQVVAVSEFSNYPEQASKLPKVGGFDGKTLSIESIISYKPDLVYITDGMHNFLISQLEEYGINYYLSTANSIEGIKKEILEVGELIGHSKEAEKVVGEMTEKIKKNRLNAVEEIPVFYEVWNVPYMTAGSKSFLTEVLEINNYKNIFSDVDEAYPVVSEESIIARNPQIIFITKSSGVTIESVLSRKGWTDISAVRNKKIIMVDDDIMSRPVPRVIDAVIELRTQVEN